MEFSVPNDNASAAARMKEIAARLNEAARAYYQEDREIMTNRAYDTLYAELEALERATGIRLAGSPTARVGYEVVGALTKVAHEQPALSLAKTKDPAVLAAFLDERRGVLSWKLDGLTVVLRYEGGQLIQAVTRGDGAVGEDVTHTARAFGNLPLAIPYAGRLWVRGEAVIARADFERINEAIPDPGKRYQNPRNLCSGAVRQLDSAVTASRHVRFCAFEAQAPEGGAAGAHTVSKAAQLAWLEGLGFDTVGHAVVTRETLADALADYKTQAQAQPCASDGLVLAFDDLAYAENLGATEKFPRGAMAFKWDDTLAETVFDHVEWNTSRTGLINPVAVFDPVVIEGTTVSRASLHNVSQMRALALGPGDRITVYKANMIIPQVAENLTQSGTEPVPAHCPVCGTATETVGQPGNDTETLICPNPNCRAQRVQALTHYAGRDAMNIEGLSEQTLEKFVERDLVVYYTDIYTLARRREDILQIEGFGEKSLERLLRAVERSKETTLPRFLYALGIRHVGLANAKLLAGRFGHDPARILDAVRGEGYEETLTAVNGFGEAIVRSLRLYFTDEANLRLISEALGCLRIEKPESPGGTARPPAATLAGLSFALTGDTARFENRRALTAFIERNGGRTVSGVSAKTSFLINNDADSASGKNAKARALGVPVLTEDAFLLRFGLDNNEEENYGQTAVG